MPTSTPQLPSREISSGATSGSPARRGRRVKRSLVRGVVVAVVLALAALMGPVTTASAADYKVRSWGVGGATVELWYSSSGWNWVVVKGAGGRGAEAGIWSANSGWRWTPSYGSAPAQFSTPAVYAPGSTCVQVRATVVSNWWPYSPKSLNTQVC